MSGKSDVSIVFKDPLQLDLFGALRVKDFDRADAILKKLPVDSAAANGETALWWQANVGDCDSFNYLLRKGATPLSQVRDGPNIMELCAMQEDRRFIEAAVGFGGNLNMISQNGRKTPIFSAVLQRRYANVKFMLGKGAYCDVADAMGTTPALLAADESAFDLVILLLRNGANPLLKNRQNYNVLRSLDEKRVDSSDPGYAAFVEAKKLANERAAEVGMSYPHR